MMIPKLMHQIWIGPHDPPTLWLDTWKDAHPAWIYRLWTNHDLFGFGWINRRHMDRYYSQNRWAGIADLMRYEILHHFGGIVVAADSVCLHPVDDLFNGDGFSLYTISTVYPGNARRSNIGATTPLYAARPHHPFTASLIASLHSTKRLTDPVRSTGNRFMQRMLKRHSPAIRIWPMHYFIPEHYNGWRYTGLDTVYARHFWGTTRNTYEKGRP